MKRSSLLSQEEKKRETYCSSWTIKLTEKKKKQSNESNKTRTVSSIYLIGPLLLLSTFLFLDPRKMALNRVCSEDFSFPLLTSRVPRIGSPPLWKPSPERGLARPVIGKDGDNDLSKSFSYVERRRSLWSDKAEEKMDMLWEELNEEAPPPPRSQSLRIDLGGDKRSSLFPDESSAVGCGMKLTKKRPSTKMKMSTNVLVLMRVLKKILIIRSSSQRSPAKTNPPWSHRDNFRLRGFYIQFINYGAFVEEQKNNSLKKNYICSLIGSQQLIFETWEGVELSKYEFVWWKMEEG